jgi:DNA-binding Xre family transcriptional regulator
VSFSVTSTSLGPKNAMLVGKSKPSATFSTTSLSSLTVGPLGDRGALAYAPKAKLVVEVNDDAKNKIKIKAKEEIHGLYSLNIISIKKTKYDLIRLRIIILRICLILTNRVDKIKKYEFLRDTGIAIGFL